METLLAMPGVNIEVTDKNNYMALDLAARNGHGPVVKLLLDTGANPSTRTTIGQALQAGGYPLLFQAVQNDYRDVVRYSVYCDSLTPDQRYHNGRTPLEFAVELGKCRW